MKQEVVGLLHFPWGEHYGVGRTDSQKPAALWRRAIVHKANPRSATYMAQAFAERYPRGRIVSVNSAAEAIHHAPSAARFVLLYPDSIGLGFGRLERNLRRVLSDAGPVHVLTGRKRAFELTPAVHRRLILRRALERTMLPELLAAPGVIVLAAATMIIDCVRGRR